MPGAEPACAPLTVRCRSSSLTSNHDRRPAVRMPRAQYLLQRNRPSPCMRPNSTRSRPSRKKGWSQEPKLRRDVQCSANRPVWSQERSIAMKSRRLLLLAGCSAALGVWIGAAQAAPAAPPYAVAPEAKSTVGNVHFRRAYRGRVSFYGPRRFYRRSYWAPRRSYRAAYFAPRRYYRARYWAPRRYYRTRYWRPWAFFWRPRYYSAGFYAPRRYYRTRYYAPRRFYRSRYYAPRRYYRTRYYAPRRAYRTRYYAPRRAYRARYYAPRRAYRARAYAPRRAYRARAVRRDFRSPRRYYRGGEFRGRRGVRRSRR